MSSGKSSEGAIQVIKKLSIALAFCLLMALASACQKTSEPNANTNANTNTNSAVAETTTRPAPDNSELTTSTDSSGVKTETRVFHGNPRISRVVVTTRGGNRTVKAYSPSGQEKELDKNEPKNALEGTGDAIADA